jgi:hypothetical protein
MKPYLQHPGHYYKIFVMKMCFLIFVHCLIATGRVLISKTRDHLRHVFVFFCFFFAKIARTFN